MSVQVISRDGKPEWAVVPYETYLLLLEQAEMLEDIQEYDRITAAIQAGEEELVPGDVVFAILDGGSRIKAWREQRRLSQQELAQRAGISVPYLSQLEAGKRKGTVNRLASLAAALNVTVDELLST